MALLWAALVGERAGALSGSAGAKGLKKNESRHLGE